MLFLKKPALAAGFFYARRRRANGGRH